MLNKEDSALSLDARVYLHDIEKASQQSLKVTRLNKPI